MDTEQNDQKEMGIVDRITGIFISPVETHASVVKKPSWLIPFIILAIMQVASFYLTNDIKQKDSITFIKKNPKLSEERAELFLSRMESQGSPGLIKTLLSYGWQIISVLLLFCILTGVFLFMGNFIMGGHSHFKYIFGVVAWSSMIQVLGKLLSTLLIYMKGTQMGVTLSFALLLPVPPEGHFPSLLYMLFAAVDFFTIWKLIVLAIGFSLAFQISKAKSYTMVFIIYVIYAIGAIGIAMLGAKFAGFV
jgi:hypothetical protein